MPANVVIKLPHVFGLSQAAGIVVERVRAGLSSRCNPVMFLTGLAARGEPLELLSWRSDARCSGAGMAQAGRGESGDGSVCCRRCSLSDPLLDTGLFAVAGHRKYHCREIRLAYLSLAS